MATPRAETGSGAVRRRTSSRMAGSPLYRRYICGIASSVMTDAGFRMEVPYGQSSVGRKGGKSPSYEDWSKQDLVKRAREIGIKGRSTMSKADLVKALRDH